MPQFIDSSFAYETNTTDQGITVPVCKNTTNDLLIILVTSDNSAATVNSFSTVPPTGWSIVEEYYNYTPAIVYMKFSGGSETDVVLTSTHCIQAETYSGSMLSIRDVNTTNPVGSKNIVVYSETNQDSLIKCGDIATSPFYEGVGQSFTTPAATASARNVGCFSKVKLYLKKVGNPTGNAVVSIYGHMGTYGTTSVPSGKLASSANFDVSTLTTTLTLVEFPLTTWYQYAANTTYCVGIEYAGGDASNYLEIGYDASAPSSSGNMSITSGGINNWNPAGFAGSDMCFYVDRFTFNFSSLTGASRNTAPVITTDKNNCLLLYARTAANQPMVPSFLEGPVCSVLAADNTASSAESIGVGWGFQPTAGSTPNNVQCSVVATTNLNGVIGVCQVNPPTAGATLIPAYVVTDNCQYIDPINGISPFAGNTGLAATCDTNYGTTLGSFTASDPTTTGAQADYGINSFHSLGAIANNSLANQVFGAEVVIAAANRFNMGSKNLLSHIMHLTPAHTQRHPRLESGRGVWFGVRSNTASGGATTGYKIYQVHGIGTPWGLFSHIPVIINADNSTALKASSGTLDTSVITSIGFWNSGLGALINTICVGSVWLMDSTVVCGGNVNIPIGVTSLIAVIAKGKERISAIQQGAKQLLLLQSVQLGNGGTNQTYVDFSESAIEFPSLYNATTGLVNYCSVPNKIGFHFYPGSSDTIDLRSAVIGSTDKFFFTFDANSSTAANVLTDGCILINAGTITLKSGMTYNGMGFNMCDTVSAAGAILNECIFDASTGTNALTITSVSESNSTDRCSFLNNARAIKITTAGEYNFDGHTFSGNTYDVENSSAGTVTINNLNQSNASTAINTGGGSTIFVTAVTVTVKCIDEGNNNLQGIVVYVENASTKAQILSTTTNASGIATTSFNYPGSDVVINIRLRKASTGATKYTAIKTTGTITATGFNLTATMYVDTIVAA